MIGGCAAAHNVSFVRQLGCSTCDKRHAAYLGASGLLQRSFNSASCFFAQNLPGGARPAMRAPAVVHGIPHATWQQFAAEYASGRRRNVEAEARARARAERERKARAAEEAEAAELARAEAPLLDSFAKAAAPPPPPGGEAGAGGGEAAADPYSSMPRAVQLMLRSTGTGPAVG